MADAPSPLHQLAARVASRDDSPAAWEPIVTLALEHGLGPMLLWSLRQSHLDVQAMPALRPLIESAHGTAMAYMLLERAQREVNAALRAATIPALWIKGSALARTVYPQPTLRPMSDLDVLVPYDQREEALRVVQALGYHFYAMDSITGHSSGDAWNLKLTPHHYHLRGGFGDSVILELHSRLLGADDRVLSLERLEWFWGQTQPLVLDDGSHCDIPTAEAHLLYLCAHALLQHGEAELHLLRFFDLHQIIAQHSLDWDTVIEQAVVFGWTTAVERALRLSMEYFATPVPPDVLTALVSRRPAHEDTTRVTRLSGPGSRWEKMRGTLAGLSARERLWLVRRVLFPPATYMRQRYHILPGRATAPYYAYRWLDQGREVVWSLWKHLTRRYR